MRLDVHHVLKVMCLEHSIDADVDLVFIDYLTNDG